MHKTLTAILSILLILSWAGQASAAFDIVSENPVSIEIRGYNALSEITLFQGELKAGERREITTPYRGLALLCSAQGASYPLLISKQPFQINIDNPETLPSFTGSNENNYFYALLQGTETGQAHHEFADLMIQAKQMLDATDAIHTLEELQTTKDTILSFVQREYQGLSCSDMVRRLIAQSFMMLEYVSYHREGAPPTEAREGYLQELIAMTADWIRVLQPEIPDHEIVNFIVDLYYQRSMITYAAILMENFPEQAVCPGTAIKKLKLPDPLQLVGHDGANESPSGTLQGQRDVAIVSSACPVSMVAAVSRARRLGKAAQRASLLVIPAEELSPQHLALQGMLTHDNIYFVNNPAWRRQHLPEKILLPFPCTYGE